MTAKLLEELMEDFNLNQKDLIKYFSIFTDFDAPTISNHISGKLKISRAFSLAYHYFFSFYEIYKKTVKTANSAINHFDHQEFTYFSIDVI